MMTSKNVSRFTLSSLVVAAGFCALSQPAFAKDEFYGMVENRPTENVGTWMIHGQQLEVTKKTQIQNKKGAMVIGTCVEVEHENGVVEEIETVNPAMCEKK